MQILDKIILDSRRGLAHITEGVHSSALLFLNSLPSGTLVKCGSHVPMKPFPDYPWVGKSLSEIYEYNKKYHLGVDDFWSDHNFAIIDERTMRDGTILLCSDSTPPLHSSNVVQQGEDEDRAIPAALATLRSDGYGSLHAMVPDEMGTKPLRDYEGFSRNGRKGEFVLTEQFIMYDDEVYLASVQAKRATGEPLLDVEKRLTGLDDYESQENVNG